MSVNKVVYGNNTLIDLTDATATADKIMQGFTAYGASGAKLTGTASGSGGTGFTGAKYSPLGLIHALETGNYKTGTIYYSSYLAKNTEHMLFDTEIVDKAMCIWIIQETPTAFYVSGTENMYYWLQTWNAPENAGEDLVYNTNFCIFKTVSNSPLSGPNTSNRVNGYRVNSGKFYYNPKYAQTNYTHIKPEITYRWIAYER